jgi:hypothetical protein
MAQDFGFVEVARDRRNTPCISRSRAAATEPKDKSATHQVLCVAVPVATLTSQYRHGAWDVRHA